MLQEVFRCLRCGFEGGPQEMVWSISTHARFCWSCYDEIRTDAIARHQWGYGDVLELYRAELARDGAGVDVND